ncbi:MAG: IPT/TIG domain-containing protein [Geobacter sp.]|nr:IPT/TIG domain-containing protein [Geobacter sp.]
MKSLLTLLFILILSSPAMAAGTSSPLPPKGDPRQKSRPAPAQERADRITILSIIPAQGEPGVTVTLSGAGFTEGTTVFLGSTEIPTRIIGPKQLSFDIPRLAAGLYALFLKTEDGSTSKTYSFSVQPLKPVATSLSPDSIPSCTMGGSRDVTINGRNFQEGALVLFDGGAIRSRFLSAEGMAFSVPAVKGGIHQIQVKNPEETVSTPLALMVDTRPEITSISTGEDHVNYYELIIEGRNFLQGSVLVVDGMRISGSNPAPGDRDRLIYMDCTRLIYQRYPADPSAKALRVQVVNPGNEDSPVITVSTP